MSAVKGGDEGAEPPHQPESSTKGKFVWKRLGGFWKRLVDIADGINKIFAAVLVIIPVVTAIIAFMITHRPQPRPVAPPQTRISSPSPSTARPSPSNSNTYRSEAPDPTPSTRVGTPLRLRTYQVRLDSTYGIPFIQKSSVPPRSGSNGQDLFYTLVFRTLISNDGGSLAPLSDGSSYSACASVQYGESIAPQKIHWFCFKGKENGIIAFVQIVPPFPNWNSPFAKFPSSPDTLTLKITVPEGSGSG